MPELMWKSHPEIAEARRNPGWAPFHRACGVIGLAFDHPVRSRDWMVDAFTTRRTGRGFHETIRLATGRGKTVLEAVAAAYEQSGRRSGDTDAALRRLLGGDDDDFDALLGDDFEELLQ